MQAFLANTLHRLGGKHVSLLRADSGFSDSAFLDHLEHQQMHYVMAPRQNQPLQRALAHAQGWWGLHDAKGKPAEGIELTRFIYQPDAWLKPAYITIESRKPILNLAIAMQQRAWMQGLWDAAKKFDLPAHFEPLYPSG